MPAWRPTEPALDDPRFRLRSSVQANRIGAVLCTPMGRSGVVYLQDRDDDAPFDEQDRRRADAFVRHLGPLVERLAARQLDLSRSYLHELITSLGVKR